MHSSNDAAPVAAATAEAPTRSKKPSRPAFYTTRLERTSYNTYWFGQNIAFILVTTFLAMFYTSTLGIPAVIVGTILFVARLWDAAVDPILATVIERTRFAGGKFKPWVRFAAISVPLLTVLCFGFQSILIDQSLAVRIGYAVITYFLWGTVYAASDGPGYALSTVMTPEPAERNVILTNNHVTGLLGILVGISAAPQILKATGGNWFLTSSILGIVALLAMLPIRVAKERVRIDRPAPPTIGEIWRSAVTNKYLVLAAVIGFIAAASNFALTLAPFVASDIYGDESSSTILLMASTLPIVFVAPFGARLIRRFGKIPILAFSYIVGAILAVTSFFLARDSLTVMTIVSLLRGVVMAPQLFMIPLMFSDSVEYDEYRQGRRFEAVTFAFQTMMSKASTAVGGGVALWIIGLAGYQASVAGQTVHQSAQALDAMWATYNLGAAIGSAIAAVILLCFYDLTESKLKVMVEANESRESIVA